MVVLTKEALLVHKALLSHGLESSFKIDTTLDRNVCKNHISEHIEQIMNLLNLDLTDESIAKTPYRIANMYIEEIFSGLDYTNFPEITFIENKMKLNQIITVHDINLTSICEHHFVIIDGNATISYIPKKYIIGLSKINRIVQFFARRPQIQERLTQQILLALKTLLNTNDVAIFINAIHYCVRARGIHDITSSTSSILTDGLFKYNQNIHQEFLHTIKR